MALDRANSDGARRSSPVVLGGIPRLVEHYSTALAADCHLPLRRVAACVGVSRWRGGVCRGGDEPGDDGDGLPAVRAGRRGGEHGVRVRLVVRGGGGLAGRGGPPGGAG